MLSGLLWVERILSLWVAVSFLAKVILTYHPQLQDLIKVYNDFFVSMYFHKLHLQLHGIICDTSARANSKMFRKGEKNSRTNLFIVQNRPQPSHLKCFREVYVAVDNIVYVRANNKIISRDVDSINWNYKYLSWSGWKFLRPYFKSLILSPCPWIVQFTFAEKRKKH